MAESLSKIEIVFPQPHRLSYEKGELVYGAGDVVMRTSYSLISPGTELALYTGTHIGIPDPDNRFAKYPFYPGYATAGEVVVAPADQAALRPGDRAFMMGNHADHVKSCWDDRRHRPIVKLPETLTDEKAIFASLAAVATTAVLQARVEVGYQVVVLGLGLVGNLAAQLFKLAGGRVVGVDRIDARVAQARRSGIDQVCHTDRSGEPLHVQMQEELGHEFEADIVVDATGNSGVIAEGLELVRPLGQFIVLGSPTEEVQLDLYRCVHRKGLSLIGAHAGVHGMGSIPDKLAITSHCLSLLEENTLRVEDLITDVLPMEEAITGYQELLSPGEPALGVALRWQ